MGANAKNTHFREPLIELIPARIDEALIVIRFSTYVGVLVCSLFSIIIWML